MGKKEKLRGLVIQKDKIIKEIESIQEECAHIDRHIKFINDGNGSVSKTRWVCQGCEKVLGVPSNTDVETWMKK